VFLQDSMSQIPLASSDEIPVSTFGGVNSMKELLPSVVLQITKEMKEGKRSSSPHHQFTNSTAGNGKLILLHGYCSTVNPWSVYKDWTDALLFLDPSANRPNQQFAEVVYQYSQKNGLTSFSIVGHSQGGIVGAHLLNYYETGLDFATNGNLISSLGTPYSGCGGAGSAANLIKLFGYGCGENFDLTRDGSSLWLSGITNDVRKQIHYYTTTYKQGTFFGDYCSLVTNLILEWPNDGTAELVYSKLAGGVYEGNKEQWCHVSGLKYSPHTSDADRNKILNTKSAR